MTIDVNVGYILYTFLPTYAYANLINNKAVLRGLNFVFRVFAMMTLISTWDTYFRGQLTNYRGKHVHRPCLII